MVMFKGRRNNMLFRTQPFKITNAQFKKGEERFFRSLSF